MRLMQKKMFTRQQRETLNRLYTHYKECQEQIADYTMLGGELSRDYVLAYHGFRVGDEVKIRGIRWIIGESDGEYVLGIRKEDDGTMTDKLECIYDLGPVYLREV